MELWGKKITFKLCQHWQKKKKKGIFSLKMGFDTFKIKLVDAWLWKGIFSFKP